MRIIKTTFLSAFLVMLSPAALSGNCVTINGVQSGDCSTELNNVEINDINVTNRTSESGIVGNINITNGGVLLFSGVAQGNVNVAAGGILVSSGVINGTVLNNGGEVEIGGVVQRLQAHGGKTKVTGVVNKLSGPGPYEFSVGSTIEGKRIGANGQPQAPRSNTRTQPPSSNKPETDSIVVLSCESKSMQGYGKYQSEFTIDLAKGEAFDSVQNQRYEITNLSNDEILLEGPETEIRSGKIFGGKEKVRPWVRISRYTLTMNWHFPGDITVGQCRRVARKRAF